MRDRFTRVLRGHIAIARAIFPDGTTGAQLDSFARQFLWQAGLDFEHGTGHGVGSYLSVHEGPARISKLGTTPLKRGMILSNEPGYYKTDAYGIRIENLELVIGTDIAGAEKPVNAFETLTLAPIDRRLIDVTMLRLRRKLERDPSNPELLRTEPPINYFDATQSGVLDLALEGVALVHPPERPAVEQCARRHVVVREVVPDLEERGPQREPEMAGEQNEKDGAQRRSGPVRRLRRPARPGPPRSSCGPCFGGRSGSCIRRRPARASRSTAARLERSP